MKKHLLLMTVFSPFTHAVAMHADPGAFRLVGSQDAISLYERWVPHDGQQPVRELKAVFRVHSDAHSVVALLRDPGRLHAWNPATADARLLTLGPGAWLSYLSYDIPWPFPNQDCLMRYNVIAPAAGDAMEIRFESTEDRRFPRGDTRDRITGVQGEWLIQPDEAGSVEIIYRISTDRSQRIPRWVSDPLVHRNVFVSLAALKHLLNTAPLAASTMPAVPGRPYTMSCF